MGNNMLLALGSVATGLAVAAMRWNALFRAITVLIASALKVVRSIRQIPLIDDLLDRFSRPWLNPVIVRQIRDPKDRDLTEALELYESRIPEQDRLESADIVRNLLESNEARRNNRSIPSDWILIARAKRQVRGFALFYYFPDDSLVVFAYLVAQELPRPQKKATFTGTVSMAICDKITELLGSPSFRKSSGLVFEVEDPRALEGTACKAAVKRIRLFFFLGARANYSLRLYAFDYRQPRLSLAEPLGSERHMLLISARRNDAIARSASAELKDVLSFLCSKVYPVGHSSDEEVNAAYQAYCNQLATEQIAAVPDEVACLHPKDFQC